MKIKMTNIWLEQYAGEQALRADFSNDRHHRVVIQPPHGAEQLSQALIDLALNIRDDPCLSSGMVAETIPGVGRPRC